MDRTQLRARDAACNLFRDLNHIPATTSSPYNGDNLCLADPQGDGGIIYSPWRRKGVGRKDDNYPAEILRADR